jgi:hypothetical protein
MVYFPSRALPTPRLQVFFSLTRLLTCRSLSASKQTGQLAELFRTMLKIYNAGKSPHQLRLRRQLPLC